MVSRCARNAIVNFTEYMVIGIPVGNNSTNTRAEKYCGQIKRHHPVPNRHYIRHNCGSCPDDDISMGLACQYSRRCIQQLEGTMPLTEKGERILASMKKEYGAQKGEEVFYAAINKGKIKGAHVGKKK